MYGNIFRDFFSNIRILKTFVSEVEMSLRLNVMKELRQSDPEGILALAVLLRKFSPNTEQFDSKIITKVEKQIGDDLEITINDDDKKKKFAVRVRSKDLMQQFHHFLSKMSVHAGKLDILLQSSLISGIVFLEIAVSRLLHCHLTQYPDSAKIKEELLSLEEIRNLGTLEEAEKYLIDREVESIMRGGLKDWIKYFRNCIKVSLSGIDDIQEELVEVFQRRNLFVHNGGVVNAIYMRNVNDNYFQGLEMDDKITISREYIDSALATIELAGAHFLLEMWKKAEECVPIESI